MNTKRISEQLKKAHISRNEGRSQEVRPLLLQLLTYLRPYGYSELLMNTLNLLAQVERDLGNTTQAIDFYNELAGYVDQEIQPAAKAHAFRHIADIHRESNHPEDAENYYLKALQLYRSSPEVSPLTFANTLRGLALLKERISQPGEAHKYWKEARSMYLQAGIMAGVEECNNWLKQ